MKERPIIFSAPMVRALLAGTKTQTRRALGQKHKPDAIWAKDPTTGMQRAFKLNEQSPSIGVPWWNLGGINGHQQRCPYGKPGDRLWVREKWNGPLVDYEAVENSYDLHEFDEPQYCQYAADGGPAPEYMDADENFRVGWKPSIHMPRWASRITLEITDVRVERLHDISVADAMAEGVVETNANLRGLEPCMEWRYAYEDLWRQINGPGSWDVNPWVWVICFKTAEPMLEAKAAIAKATEVAT